MSKEDKKKRFAAWLSLPTVLFCLAIIFSGATVAGILAGLGGVAFAYIVCIGVGSAFIDDFG